MSLYSYLEWFQHTPFSTAIRESVWVFPIIETTHVLALSLSTGLLVWFDLRLLGLVMRDQPVSVLHKQMMPWSNRGIRHDVRHRHFTFLLYPAFCLYQPLLPIEGSLPNAGWAERSDL